jgi:hypothetical protein
MHQSLALHSLPDSGLHEQIDRAALEYARTDPAGHVFTRLPLDDDVVDAVERQQL